MQSKSASNVKVIDVSHHQDKVDWKKVAASGVQGAFIKATEGGSMIDLKLSSHAPGAAAAGLKVGFYHYAHPELNAPETEAANFFRNVKQYKADFPYVLDVEGEASQLGAEELTKWCVKWLTAVERLSGKEAMIYTGASFAKSYLGILLRPWPLWVAHYDVETPMANPTWDKWSVFQYTSKGTIDGIVGNVDINAMEKAFFDGGEEVDTIKIVVNDKLIGYGQSIDGTVYVPVRALGEALGAKVTWDPETQKVYIYS